MIWCLSHLTIPSKACLRSCGCWLCPHAPSPQGRAPQAHRGWPGAHSAANVGRADAAQLLVVADLIVQDDPVGLLRLGPGQRDAPHRGTHLVHDGHGGGGCRGREGKLMERGRKNGPEEGENPHGIPNLPCLRLAFPWDQLTH